MAATRSRRARPDRGLVLFHGAGSDRDHSSLVLLESRLAPTPVARVNFPYRDKPGRRPPDREPVLVQAVVDAAASFTARNSVPPDRAVFGGRSMGGRMCSLAVARGLPAAGLALIAYPLHPPGKPEKLRSEHFADITVPVLVVHGTRDPFGAPDEIERHFAAMSGPVVHEWVDGGRHDLKGADQQIADAVERWLRSLS